MLQLGVWPATVLYHGGILVVDHVADSAIY